MTSSRWVCFRAVGFEDWQEFLWGILGFGVCQGLFRVEKVEEQSSFA